MNGTAARAITGSAFTDQESQKSEPPRLACQQQTLGRNAGPKVCSSRRPNSVGFHADTQLALGFIDRADRVDAMAVEIVGGVFEVGLCITQCYESCPDLGMPLEGR